MQQHGSKYFPRRSPTPDPGGWVKRIWLFSISNRRECRMQPHGNKYYALRTTTPPHADPPFDTGVWSKGQNSTFSISCLPANLGADVKRSKFNFFSENGHVEYQIKGNGVCSKIFCTQTAPSPECKKLKFNFFRI